MHLGVAIDLAGRGQKEARARLLGQGEEIVRSDDAGQHRVLGIRLVMGRRRRAGEIEHLIDLVRPERRRQERDG